MFETNPEVKRTFEKFRQLDTPSQLWHSTVLETHGMVVMNTLDEIIAALDDEDENVAEIIVEQGRSHARFSDDFDEQTFWVKRSLCSARRFLLVRSDLTQWHKKSFSQRYTLPVSE